MANEQARAFWGDQDRVATWPLREQFTSALIAPLLEYARIAPRSAVLDVGCGGGISTFSASVMTGPRGSVLGVDIFEPMIDLARERRDTQGMDNVSFEVADLETDHVTGAPFDAAISLFGVMFFDDPVAAFANIAGQLNPHASFTFASWQAAVHNEWAVARRVIDALTGGVPAPPPTSYVPGQFGFSNRDRTTTMAQRGGFTGVEWALCERTVDVDLDALIDEAAMNALGLDDDGVRRARDLAREYLEPLGIGDDRYRCTLAAQLATMTVRS